MALQIDTFADESGIEPDQGYCLIAGYTSNPTIWPVFVEKWEEEVHESGFTRFKASDFFTLGRAQRYRRGEYEKAKWRPVDSRADAHLDRLLSIIETHNVVPSAAVVRWADFNMFSSDEQKILAVDSPRRHPYYLAMFDILGELVVRSDNLPLPVQMNLILERQTVLRDYAIDAFNAAFAELTSQGISGSNRLGRVSYSDPITDPQLQAADLWAYTLRRTLVDGASCPDEVRQAFDRARRGVEFTVWDEAQLRKLLMDYKSLPGDPC